MVINQNSKQTDSYMSDQITKETKDNKEIYWVEHIIGGQQADELIATSTSTDITLSLLLTHAKQANNMANTVLLEARPYRPFKSSEEYLYAMREDLAEWLNTMYPDLRINTENFMDRLDTGVALCKVCSNGLFNHVLEQSKIGIQNKIRCSLSMSIAQYPKVTNVFSCGQYVIPCHIVSGNVLCLNI